MNIPQIMISGLVIDNRPQEVELETLKRITEWPLDTDYVSFISQHDGFDGFLSHDQFLSIWRVKDVIAVYPYYPDVKVAEDFLFFGSDGASYGFAFLRNSNEVVGMDFLEIGIEPPEVLAKGFLDFLFRLEQGQGPPS